MAKYNVVYQDETLELSHGHDGYWLYDHTRGMNLGMRETSAQNAYVEAIRYYQQRLTEVESQLKALKTHVTTFVETLPKGD